MSTNRKRGTRSGRERCRKFILAAAVAATGLPLVPAPASAGGLTNAAHKAVLAALDDEYHAEAVYRATIQKFGNVRPFANIIRAEQQHQAAMKAILVAYGKPVPANPWLNGTRKLDPLPATLGATCRVGVAAEKANRTLYDKQLLPQVRQYPRIQAAMKALRDASEYRHLPAFERCAARNS